MISRRARPKASLDPTKVLEKDEASVMRAILKEREDSLVSRSMELQRQIDKFRYPTPSRSRGSAFRAWQDRQGTTYPMEWKKYLPKARSLTPFQRKTLLNRGEQIFANFRSRTVPPVKIMKALTKSIPQRIQPLIRRVVFQPAVARQTASAAFNVARQTASVASKVIPQVTKAVSTGGRLLNGLASGFGDFASFLPGAGLALTAALALPQMAEEARVATYNSLTSDQRDLIDRTHYDLTNPFSPDRWFLPDWWKSGVNPAAKVIDELPLGEFASSIPRYLETPGVPRWFQDNVRFLNSLPNK